MGDAIGRVDLQRRRFLKRTAGFGLAAGGLAVLSGCELMPQKPQLFSDN